MARRVLASAAVLIAGAAALAAFLWVRLPHGASHARPPSLHGQPTSRRVLFVGLDGADWQYLDLLIDRGVMPNLQRLVVEGDGGTLRTIHPPLSPLVWTTMMTGRSPLDHGILDFTRFNPETGVVEPITSDERRVPAIWNMSSRNGAKTAVIGLWATFPPEHIAGMVVSDRFFSMLPGTGPLARGAVFPETLESWARETEEEADEKVGFGTVKRYLPWLTEDEYRRDAIALNPYARPLSALRQILVETTTVTGLAMESLERDAPQLAIVYYQGTDTIGHVFAPYVPPRQEAISEDDFERYSGVAELYFQEIDRVLGEYRARAEAGGAVLMIASDHGFSWLEGRPTELSSLAAPTAARWHRDDGMYLLWGHTIPAAPGHRRKGSVTQVCSTLLALLGVPPAKGIAVPPLPGAPPLGVEVVDYAAGFHREGKDAAAAGPETDEQIEKLKALGYVGDAGSAVRTSGSTRTASSYNNEGLLFEERGEKAQATAAFEHALAIEPEYGSASWNLSELLFSESRDLDRADKLLVTALAHSLPDGSKHILGRAVQYQRTGRLDRALSLLTKALTVRSEDFDLRLLRGRCLLERQECPAALADFKAAARIQPASALAQSSLGVSYLCLGDRAEAAAAFRKSLELDPEQPQVRDYLRSAK